MKKQFDFKFWLMIIGFMLALTLLTSCNDNTIMSRKEIITMCEQCYFEGQKDAINGDIRIKLNKDSVYMWIKSPWNDDSAPIFMPTYLDTNN